MPGMMDVSLNDIPDLVVLETNTECQLKIESIEHKTSENTGREFVEARMTVVGEPTAEDIYHRVFGPMDGDDEKKADRFRRRMRDFCIAYGFDPAQGIGVMLENNAAVGGIAWGVLDIEEDAQYGKKNVVKSFTLPEKQQ